MNIVIVGAGLVGTTLAEELSRAGHDVSVVERDRRKVQQLRDSLDVLVVRGQASRPSVLERAGIRSAEMAIAVTDVDEVNIVVGMLAAQLGARHRVVRIRNRELHELGSALHLADLGIDRVVNPDPVIVRAIAGIIAHPGTTDYATLAGGQVVMLAMNVPPGSPAEGYTLAQLRDQAESAVFLCLTIKRGDQVIVPKGLDRLEVGDKIRLLVSKDSLDRVVPLIHPHASPTRSVILAGASRVGLQLAEELQGKVERLYLIEPDEAAAEEAARWLDKTTVLCGDPTDLEVLAEASLDRCDLFCAVSENDQRNMLAALLAKRHGGTRAAVLLTLPTYGPVLDSLGIEIVISPRLVVAGEILAHVRRGHVHSVTRLAEHGAEIIEMEVPPHSPAAKAKLSELKFPAHALLGVIVRDGEVRIPDGQTQCRPGDVVLVYALPDAIGRIEKLFSRRTWW